MTEVNTRNESLFARVFELRSCSLLCYGDVSGSNWQVLWGGWVKYGEKGVGWCGRAGQGSEWVEMLGERGEVMRVVDSKKSWVEMRLTKEARSDKFEICS